MRADPAALGSALANRVFGHEPWVRDKLRTHAGCSFSFRVGPIENRFLVSPEGELEPLDPAALTDLRLSLATLDVPAFLADPRRWDEFVVHDGDDALAATLRDLAPTLPWFVEQAFERAFGAVVGQRLADAGRRLLAFPEYARRHLGDNVASFARDRNDVVARSDEMATLAADIEAVSLRAAQLRQRVESLEATLPTSC